MIKPTIASILSLVLVAGAFGAGAAGVVWTQTTAPVAQTSLSLPTPLIAQAAILYDLKTGQILYQKNAQEPLALASLTKLMTLQAALAESDPSTRVRITQEDVAPMGDWGLRPGDHLSLRDLVKLSLVASSNDAAAAVASSIGTNYLSAMNDAAQDLNLTRTSFSNPTGLDLSSSTAGAYGSAFDVARLTAAFYKSHPELFALTTKPAVSVADGSRTLSFDATMAPLQNIPGFIGAKTGYTDLAGGNLAAIFDIDIGHPVVAVVLHSSESGRFSDVRSLVEALRNHSTTP